SSFDSLEKIVAAYDLTSLPITSESKNRRHHYLQGLKFKNEERAFKGITTEFLSTLNLKILVEEAQKDDLQRAVELTERTSQLNSTGITYSFDQILEFCTSSEHVVLVAKVEDRFGRHGLVGLVIVETTGTKWMINLLLVSCRMMSRGIGSFLLNYTVIKAC